MPDTEPLVPAALTEAKARAVELAQTAAVKAVYLPSPSTQAASDFLADLSVAGPPDYDTEEGRTYYERAIAAIEAEAAERAVAEWPTSPEAVERLATAFVDSQDALTRLNMAVADATEPFNQPFTSLDMYRHFARAILAAMPAK